MKVLLATDRSNSSAGALDYLKQLSFADPVDLHLTSVVPMSMEPQTLDFPPVAMAMIEDESAAIKEHLADLSNCSAEFASDVHTSMNVGSPSYSIVESAEHHESELVVLGAIGKSAIERALLGSVSDFVATHAPCSTMIVRPSGTRPAGTPKRIVLALASDDEDSKLVDFLGRFIWPSDTDVHLYHVMQPLKFGEKSVLDEAKDYWAKAESLIHEHAETVKQPLTELIDSTKIKVAAADHIGQSIVKYAEDVDCDLLIIGDSHHSFLNRVFLGSTSRFVLRHASCSVVVVR